MKKNKHFLATIAMLLCCLTASAYDFEVDGIYYNITSDTKVEVTFKGAYFDIYSNEYSGSITIPAAVAYDDVIYSVTSIGSDAFRDCSSLTSITILEGVAEIGDYAFYGCSSLTSISIPESVTSIGGFAFNGTTWYNDRPDGVVYLGRVLCGYKGEMPEDTNIEVSEGTVSIGDYAFYGCSSLTSITIPEGVISIGYRAFSDCSSLTTITLSESVMSIGVEAFFYCGSLKSITIPEGMVSIGEQVFRGCSSLTTITIPESVASIGSRAFDGCSALVRITIPENSKLASIGDSAFDGCSSLTTITIPESVASIGRRAFDGCHSLKSITLPESVISIGGYAFRSCSSLTSITIPENVTSIGDSTFEGCSSLESITIPENVTSIGGHAFYGCHSLKSITLPESVISIGGYAFSRCESITSITIPESVTSIGGRAFSFCRSLRDVNVHIASIESWFNNNFSSSLEKSYSLYLDGELLSSVEIPSSVTSIPNNAFYDCKSITSVNIPENVEFIYQRAFAKCSALERIKVLTTEPPFAYDNTFSNYGIELCVPEEAMEAYRTTAPWSSFGTIVGLGAPITSITLSPSSTILTERETLALTLTTTPANADRKLISWSSSDPSTATVDNTGKVTAIATGTTTITATANDGSGVSASCEITVMPASYIITFLIDGEVFLTDTLTRGTAITLPEAPEKEGYTFSGWSEVPETMPAGDLTISGIFIINKYLVTFKIGDEVIAADSLEYGAEIVAPEALAKEGYTFKGWGEVAETVPAHDVTYVGSYSVNSYLLTVTVDGEIVQTDSIVYGTAITLPEAPTKEGYTFSGWGEVPETMPAGDVTISGTFIINKYLVTFKIGDEVVAADSLEYNSAIVAPEAPAKEGYTFNGWGEVAETVPANDVTYEGSYSVNSYLLTVTVDGETVQADSIAYGTAITLPEAPTKEGYTFSGWGEVPAMMPAGDVTISGTFIINKYLVTFKIGDEVIAADSLEYGATIVAPETPEKEGHTFNGWGEVAATVSASDVTYEGSYTVNVYNVYYYVGEDLVHTEEVAYGEVISEYIYEPTIEGDVFVGWIGETYETMPAHDVTYTANIESGIEELTIDNSQLTIYDLMGRKVTDTENLKGGIYIVNGRKIVIK